MPAFLPSKVVAVLCVTALLATPSCAFFFGDAPIAARPHDRLSTSSALARSDDPCQWYAGEARLFADAQACFDTVPYSASVANQTAESLLRAMQLYAFTDIATDPPVDGASRGLEIKRVDVLGGVRAIAQRKYDRDYDMQADLAALFRGLQDAHTRYKLPLNYQSFVAGLPLHFVAFAGERGDDGEQGLTVHVSPISPDAAAIDLVRPLYPDADLLVEFANATVLSVNGQDPAEFFTAFANESVGISKDIGTRLNIVFNAYEPSPTTVQEAPAEIAGLFSTRHGDFAPFPGRGERSVDVELMLANGTAINTTAPWIAVATADVTSESFASAYWRSGPPSGDASRVSAVNDDLFSRRRRPNRAAPGAAAAHAAARERAVWNGGTPLPRADSVTGACTGSTYCFDLLMESPDVRMYRIIGDPRTVVLYWNTFGPSDEGQFSATVQAGLDKAAGLGLDRLIIDATGNGGGDICLGRRMLQLLFGPHYAGPTDMPRSPLSDAMAESAPRLNLTNCVWCADEYAPDGGGSFSPNSGAWMLSGPTHVRGGRKRAYSQLLHLSDLACSYDPDVPVGGAAFLSEVIIATHGLCGSTCAYFTQHAALYDHVKLVAIGGLPGRPMDANSFPGLQVLDTPFVWQEIESHFPNNEHADLVPPELKTSAHYRMCVREIYPCANSTTPTEYTFIPADYRITSTYANTMHPEFAWFDIVKFFSDTAAVSSQ